MLDSKMKRGALALPVGMGRGAFAKMTGLDVAELKGTRTRLATIARLEGVTTRELIRAMNMRTAPPSALAALEVSP